MSAPRNAGLLRRLGLSIACALLALAAGGRYAEAQSIVLDSTSSATGPAANVNTLTWSHTVGSGSNRILLVGVTTRDDNVTVNGVSYSAQALTRIGSRVDAGTNVRMEIWKLLAPPVGMANVVINLSAGKRLIGGAVSFFGVNQTTPHGAFAAADGSSTTPSVTLASAAGEVVFDTVATKGDSNSLASGPSQREQWSSGTGTGGGELRSGGSVADGASSVTTSWTLGASKQWAIGAVSLKPAQNLTLSKTDAPDPVIAGNNITYTLSYSNTGTSTATGVVITDRVPTNTTFVSATGGGTLAGSIVTWTIGSLAAGASGSVQLVVQTRSPLNNGSLITNGTFSIDSNETTPVSGTAITTTISSAPILTISKSDAPDPVLAGANITYTISYANTGNMNASSVVITDTAPVNTTFVSATNGGTLGGGVVTWTLGTVVGGTSGYVQMVVQVAGGLPNGTVITNATYGMTSTQTGPVAGAAITTTVNPATLLTATKIVTDDNGGSARPSEVLTYTITITNGGGSPATSVTLTDFVPANTTYLPGTLTSDDPTDVIIAGSPLQVQAGTLAAFGGGDNDVVITFKVQIDSGAANGLVLSNQATVDAGGGISIQSDDPGTPATSDATKITVVNPLNVSLTKTRDKANAKPGETITYTLSYSNTGSVAATNVSLADFVPFNTTFVSATGGGTLSGGAVTWSIVSIPAGGSGSRQFTVTVNTPLAIGTVISNSGSISFEDDLGNSLNPKTSNTVTTTVIQGACVIVDPDAAHFVPAGGGKKTTYAFTVTNCGNGTDRFDLTDVKIRNTWQVELLTATGGNIAKDNSPADGIWNTVQGGFDTDGDGLPDTGNIAAGATVTYKLRITNPGNTVDKVDITRIVATSNLDPAVSDYAEMTTTAQNNAASIDVSKVGTPDPVAAGGNITYTITITNDGTVKLNNVVASDAMPANTTFFSATSPYTLSGNTVTWSLGTMNVGASLTRTLVVKVGNGVPNGTAIFNTVGVSSTETGGPGTPIEDTEVTTVQSPVSFATSTKSVNFAVASPGSTLTYTISVVNSGVNNATGVVVQDTVPDNTTYVPGSITGPGADDLNDPDLVWSVGNVAAGATVNVTYQARVVSPVPAGTTSITNTAAISSTQTSQVDTNTATTSISAAPKFTLSTKAVSDLNGGLVTTGDVLRYTIVVRNTGNMSASGVVVTDTVPAGTTYVAGSITGTGADASGAPNLVWNVGSMNGLGGSTTLTFDVKIGDSVALGTVLSNVASVASAQTAAVNTNTVSSTVQAGYTGSLTSTPTINPGQTVTLTLTDRNLNTNPATVQTVNLTTVNTVTGESETRTYTETGPDTGVFMATVATVFGTTAGTNNDGTFNVKAGDTLSTTYNDALTSTGGVATVTAVTTVVTTCVDGTLTASVTILPTQPISITVTDADLNGNPAVAETTTVTVNNPTTGETETVTLTETGVNTGVFTGTLATSEGSVANPAIGIIAVAKDDVLTTTYSETCSGLGGPAIRTAATTVIKPVLAISKSDAPDPVSAGSNITYTLSYANTGTADASGVVITDTVPANTTFVSATGGGTLAGGVVTWTLGALVIGGSGSVDLVVKVNSPLANGTLIANATFSITSAETGPAAGAAIATTVTSAPVLAISKSDAPDPVAAGANITYTLSYSNTGNENASSVSITDTIPANTTFVSATGGGTLSGGVVTWALGALNAGVSSSVQLVVQVTSPLANGTVITNATFGITSAETGLVSGAAITTTVTSAPVLGISKTDAPDPVNAGANITYTLTATNTGNENASGTVITDTIPANTTFVSASGGGTLSGGVVTWAIGLLPAGGSVVRTLTVQVASPLANGTVITNGTYNVDSNETAPVAGASVTTTVTSAPVLGISKTDAPDPVSAGANITYTISYNNTGNENASGVVITDTVPGNTTFVSATGGGTLSGGVVTWTIGGLAAGGSGSVQLVVQVASPLANGTVITNGTYNIDSNETAPVAGAAVTTTVSSAPVLGISKTDAPDPVSAGANITYTISYNNTGNDNASGVVITDTVPGNTTFVSATGGGTLSGGVVTWTIGALAAGGSGSVQLVVKANSPLANGTVITNGTYNIDSNETAPVAGAAVTTTVSSAPVLGISKTDAPDPVTAGANITYTISYNNTGNENASGVVITDTVPGNTTFVSATGGGTLSGGVVTWTIGGLAAGGSGSVQLVVQVASPLANGTVITNGTYNIDSNETAPVAGAAVTTTVSSAPVLGISKTDAPDPVSAGANITYTISYNNTGNDNASGVVITDTVPGNTTFVSATGGGTLSGGVVTWTIGALAAGGSGSVQLVVKANSPLANGTVITNGTYNIDSNETAPVAGAAVTTTVSSAPVLGISKTDAPDPVTAGANITYTISYNNTGNENASGVVITDTVPVNTTFVSATGGGTLSGGVVTWTIGGLAAGGSGSVQLVVQVASPLPNGTLITNGAYNIDSNETAPVAGAAVTTTVSSAPVLGISKTDAPDPVSAGANITYTISYNNTGNDNASGVVITDTVPGNTTFVSATGGGTLSGGVVTWTIGALAAGGSGSVQLVVKANSPLANGTVITNGTYNIDSNETAPVAGAAVTTTVSSAPVLGISKTDAPDPVTAGANITYTISYNNTGNENATGVVITDTVPVNTTFVSATGGGTLSGGVVTWTIGALAAGGSGSVQLVVQVASPLPNGTLITNGAYDIDSNETVPVAGAAITTTVGSAPVLNISKSDAPDPVAAGANITYTLSYSNTGTEDASGVVITDTVPANTTFVSATGGGTLSGGVVTWTIGALAAGAAGSVQLVAQVTSPLANGTVITNATYAIDSNETAPVAGAADTTTVTSAPVLSISKGDAPDPVAAGANITYTISFGNAGNENASGVVVNDTVPVNTTFVSATGGGTLSGGVVTWTIGGLAAGGSASVQLVVKVNSPLANGTVITNATYSINSNETTSLAGAAITTTVTSAPVLGISKADAPDPVTAGANITYTLTAQNTGNENASGTVIADTVPVNTTFVSASGGGTLSGGVVTWNIGALAAGATVNRTLTVKVASPLANGTVITNATYSVTSNEAGPVAGAPITTTVTSAPVLAISKSDSPDPVAAGANITYTISYGNSGNENASGVVITDTVPVNTTFVSATGGGTLSGGVVTWSIGGLAAGASATVQMVVQVDSPLPDGTLITNGAYDITSNEIGPIAGGAITTTVTSSPILNIGKTDAPDPAVAGTDNITYTLSYSNSGNSAATGVTISDTVPAGTTFVSATGGGTLSGGVVTWTIGGLAAGGSGSVQMVVSIDVPVANGAIITNGTYSITSNEVGPVSGAADTTTVLSDPRFTLGKSGAPDPVAAGSDITYTLSYDNVGTNNATGTIITDPLPVNTTFVSATAGGTLSGGVVTWAIGNVNAGVSGSVQLVVKANSPLANGTVITNTGWQIQSNESLPQTGPDATTTVTSAPVLAVSKTDSPDPVAPGADITYTITYSNTGNENASGVVISDTVPANTTFVSATGGGTFSGGIVTWTIGGLAAGGPASVQLVVKVDSPLANGTIITNATYDINSNETAPVAGVAVTTTVNSAPVLNISKTDGPDPVAAGANITYTISYSNTGTANATGVAIADTVPANTTFVSATAGGTLSGGVVTWAIGGLAAGGSGSVQLVVQVTSPLANGTVITNATYSITSNEAGPASGAAATTTVTSSPVLAISKTDGPDPVAAGANITYTISYGNTGNANATGVVITDTVPANTTFVSATGGGTLSGGVVTWAIGGLAAGGSGSVQMVVQVTSPLANGTVITNATYAITSNEAGPVSGAAATTTVTSAPVLAISKTDSPDPVTPGGDITYTISYSNTGNENASGVVITDTVPANTTFVSATGGGTLSGGVVTWTIGALAAGGSASVQLVVKVDNPLANGTVITNGTYDIDSTETALVSGAAVTTTVNSAPVLGVSKTDGPDPVAAGANIAYTISYANTGTENATGVAITDTVPANTTFVSATAGGTLSGGVVTWAIGGLAAGGSGSVQMVVQVTSPLANGTVITNATYGITSSETGAVSGAAETTTVTSAPMLSISKTDGPDPVAAGANITYTISYGNSGNANATSVAITDTVPANTTFVSATGGGTLSGGVVTWAIGGLAAGGSGSVQMVVQVTSPLANGTVITNATYAITSNEAGPASGAAATTTVTSSPVLSISKTDGPDPVAAGANITYTISYGNSGNANATSVAITDTVPANTTFVSATGGGTLSGGVVTWAIGGLAAGGSASVQMVVQVTSPLANGTVITNATYAITSNEAGPVGGAAATTTVNSAPVLAISKTDGPDPVAAGASITYTISYGNTGNANATGVAITDTVPANTTFVSATGGGTLSGGVVTWAIGGLAAGGSGSVQMVVQVTSPLANGSVITNATYAITSNETGATAGAAATTTVTSAPVLSVSKTDGPDPVAAGANITYTISYGNTGNTNATGVVITDTVPANTTFVSATAGGTLSGGVVTWAIGGLAAGGSGSVQMVAQVTSPLANGTVITNATYAITSNEAGPVSGAAATTTVTSSPALSISKTDGPDPVAAGANITYTISYGNSGNANATGVVITDTVPANTTFVSATAGGTLSGGVVTWNIGGLAAGGSGSVQMVVQVASPLANGTVITNATYGITSNEAGPESGAAATTTVTSSPVLAISKTDGPDPVSAGANITYIISYSNTGNENATGAVITDTVPANTTFVSATAGGTLSGGVVTWNIGGLAAGGSGSVQMVVQVTSPLANGTVITNGVYDINSNETGATAGAAVTTTVTSAPILTVSKAGAPNPVAAGANITYIISYSNAGNENATGVVITDTVPANTTFVSATGGGVLSGGVVTWTIGNLNAGVSSSVQLVVRVNSPLANGTVLSNATYDIDSDQTAPAAGAAVSTTVTSSPSLTISKTDGPDPVAAGASITYTISYANSGNANATGVVIADTLPANTTFVSATAGGTLAGGVVTWTSGALAAGGSGSVQLVVQTNSPLPNGTVITNGTYSIDSNETAPTAGAAATTTVTSAPNLIATKAVGDDNGGVLEPGDVVTYTITVTNTGNADATNVLLTDPIPANTTLVAGSLASDDPADVKTPGNPLTVAIGTLRGAGGGDSDVVITFKVRLDTPLANGTVISNQGTITADGPLGLGTDDPSTGPIGDATARTVVSAPVLGATKTAVDDNGGVLIQGDVVTYTITVRNTGNADATNVLLSDAIPANTTLVAGSLASDDGTDVKTEGNPLSVAIGTLGGAGGSDGDVVITFKVQLATPLAGGTVVSNQGSVTADGPLGIVSDDPSTGAPNDATDLTVTGAAPALTMLGTVQNLTGAILHPGDTLLYTITVRNTGTSDATTVVVSDPIPANTVLVPGSLTSDDPGDILTEGNPLVIQAGTLAAPGNGDSDVVITYRVIVNPAVLGGTMINNQGSLTAAGGITRISDDPGRNDGLETGNDPADPADDDETLIGPVSLGDVLQIAKTADTIAVRRGDFILYTVTITNPTAADVVNVSLHDTLPVGVSLVRGSLALDGVPQSDPPQAVPFVVPIGVVSAAPLPNTRTVAYRGVVNSGAVIGSLVNRAVAVDAASQPLSRPADNTVALLEDPEFDLGTIIGKVFDDKDGNGVQGPGENGVGGAMVAMEDGVYSVTDQNGMYHIAAARPGNRLVKINRFTLPANDGLTLPEAQTVTLTPGLLVKVNFGVRVRPMQTIRQGRPGSYGIAVANETISSEASVAGNLDDMTAVVNGVQAHLPKARVKMDVLSLERNLRIANGRLVKPAVFQLSYPTDRPLREWTFEIYDAQTRHVRSFRGVEMKTGRVTWDGKDDNGVLVAGGGIYQYQLTMEFADGSLSKSPLRLFGVNRTSAISFELTGASFDTNGATLKPSAASILDEVAATLKKYPGEKVVVRGHTDNTGDEDWNARLSAARAASVRDYLVAAGIPADRLVTEGRGAASPVAPNTTPDGRARNRRVDIKALLKENELAPVFSAAGSQGEREVVVNGRRVPADEDGSFQTTVDPTRDKGRVYVGIKTEDGGLAAATVTLPTITIIEPSAGSTVEIGSRKDVIKLMQPASDGKGLRYPAVNVPVRGRTEPGNQLFVDGSPVKVAANGSFKTDLSLAVGENVFGMVAVGTTGSTSLVNLAVNLAGVDAKRELITVRKPVPQFSVEMPPRGAVLTSPNLFVRGTAPAKASVTINQWHLPVASNGTFAGTVRLPDGPSTIEVVVTMPDGGQGRVGVPVQVTSDYFFLVALGDATVNKITTTGRVPEKYEDDLYVDGRIALYMKGRIQGKYLITAGLDTGDGRLSEIGSRLGDRDNSSFYRTLDPDSFYPVYGDGSRTVKDTNSQGRFYVLVEAPSSSFEWGNYNSGITGNEFSSFDRSLYGAKASWKSLTKRKDGQPFGQAIVFAALPETRSAHDEFSGTGGSLYFLRNKGILPGSEKVRLEVRDKITGIPVANVTRSNFVDYEIDYAEGRILFRTPVSSIADTTTLISDGLLNGNPVFVVVDYEYNDLQTAPMDQTTYGARVKQTVGENVIVGGTYVKEERAAGTYTLEGGDVTVKVGKDTQVIAEYSQTRNESLPQYVSTDGGLSFTQKSVVTSNDAAQAYKFEFATTQGPARLTGYVRHIDEGFSSSFTAAEHANDQYGSTLALKFGRNAAVDLLFDRNEVSGVSTMETSTLQYRQTLGKFGLAGEARYRTTDNASSPDTTEGVGAIRLDYRPTPRVDVFARYQDDFLQRNDAATATTGLKRQTTLGADIQLSPKVNMKTELTTAKEGDAVLVGLTTKVDRKTVLYGTYSLSPDQAGSVTGVLTLGAASALTDRTKLYTEEQFKTGDQGATTTNTVGLSTRLSDRLTTSVAFERSRLNATGSNPDTLRQAGSASASYAYTWFKIFSKFEIRKDDGTGLNRSQWLSTNAFEMKVTRDLTFLGRYNYGVTTDNLTDSHETVFREQSLGVAYRPVAFDWINFLTRYTQVRNLPPGTQVIARDQTRDTVFSFQTVVDMHRRVSLTEKYAVRDHALDQALLADLKSQLRLWINRFNYHLSDTWDAALEYRTLSMTEAAENSNKGFLLEVNRLFLQHMRVGVGYNFTDFTDNEFSANDYSAKGFFFRIQGKY